MAEPTHYEVLSLPQALLDRAKADQAPILIKQAYHRALLRHHPDKAPRSQSLKHNPSSRTSAQHQPTYTIDQITTAHATLSSPPLRARYDAYLRTAAACSSSRIATAADVSSSFQTGIETVDLDDLDYGDAGWSRPCRCGNERGFAFGEADLEEAGDLGELLVGCADCSLWLRVCFAVVVEDGDDDDDDDDDDGATGGDEEGLGQMGEEAREKRGG